MAASMRALPWQLDVWRQFEQLLLNQRLGHANLISGEPGIGKQHFASAFTARLLCAAPVDDHACGHCHACEVLQAGSHPDFMLLEPAEGSQVISVDDVRQLTKFVAHTPQLGENKVVMIRPAEALNLSAANALLKSLEEPQNNTYFLLLSEAIGRLPATIRSRCQIHQFVQPESAIALSWLNASGEQVYTEQDLARVNGRPFLLLQGEDAMALDTAIEQGLLDLAAGRVSVIALADNFSKLPLLEALSSLQAYLVRLCKSVHCLKADESQQMLEQRFGRLPLLHLAEQVQSQLVIVHAGQHPNARLCFETLLIDLQSSLRQ
jgi:DNA polymerase-3 subunit delta'